MKTYYATHHYEIIPCHLVAIKDRDGRGKYVANSKRDKRRFKEAFEYREDAMREVVKYANKLNSKD